MTLPTIEMEGRDRDRYRHLLLEEVEIVEMFHLEAEGIVETFLLIFRLVIHEVEVVCHSKRWNERYTTRKEHQYIF